MSKFEHLYERAITVTVRTIREKYTALRGLDISQKNNCYHRNHAKIVLIGVSLYAFEYRKGQPKDPNIIMNNVNMSQ